MFNSSTKKIVIAAILTLTTAATSVQAGEFRHHRGNDFGNAAAIGLAGFALGAIIGGTLRNPDGSTVSSHGFQNAPGVRFYEERDRHGRVIKREIRKKKKVRILRKKRPVFASSYDPRTNIRVTSYRDRNGQRVVIRTRGRALPPQVR